MRTWCNFSANQSLRTLLLSDCFSGSPGALWALELKRAALKNEDLNLLPASRAWVLALNPEQPFKWDIWISFFKSTEWAQALRLREPAEAERKNNHVFTAQCYIFAPRFKTRFCKLCLLGIPADYPLSHCFKIKLIKYNVSGLNPDLWN